MNVKRAIEILELDKTCDFEGSGVDLESALQLGVEALKWIKENRVGMAGGVPTQLPGETPEEE